MRKISTAVAGVAVAALAALLPATAQATPSQVSADGNLHAYLGVNRTTQCAQWAGNSSNWGSCANVTHSLWNNGVDDGMGDVLVYWGTGYSGAYRCIDTGTVIDDLSTVTFNRGTGGGRGQTLENNIASHRWVPSGTC
ncbi:hypothetical protein [Kitasatospora sp. NPDC057015]|uniref:hypothetical protein n=1 Tax=Kitasatospora sp. NPDC057015 TaxID=3346001 RepID=UPI003632DC64